MSSYYQALQDALQSGFITEGIIKKHVEQQVLIDRLLPNTNSFFYVLEMQTKRYRFFGRQQVNVSGYTNEEFCEAGVELFLKLVHPDDISILLYEVYPQYTHIVETTPLEDRKRVQLQYNYRFLCKNGEYHNLFEQLYVLELDDDGETSLILGNVIVLNNKEVLPVRFACKRINEAGVSETICFKSFSGKEKSLDSITAREMDVLRSLAVGMTSREIADQLFISKHTVDTHRRNLLKKLDCKSVVELVQIAFANGMI